MAGMPPDPGDTSAVEPKPTYKEKVAGTKSVHIPHPLLDSSRVTLFPDGKQRPHTSDELSTLQAWMKNEVLIAGIPAFTLETMTVWERCLLEDYRQSHLGFKLYAHVPDALHLPKMKPKRAIIDGLLNKVKGKDEETKVAEDFLCDLEWVKCNPTSRLAEFGFTTPAQRDTWANKVLPIVGGHLRFTRCDDIKHGEDSGWKAPARKLLYEVHFLGAEHLTSTSVVQLVAQLTETPIANIAYYMPTGIAKYAPPQWRVLFATTDCPPEMVSLRKLEVITGSSKHMLYVLHARRTNLYPCVRCLSTNHKTADCKNKAADAACAKHFQSIEVQFPRPQRLQKMNTVEELTATLKAMRQQGPTHATAMPGKAALHSMGAATTSHGQQARPTQAAVAAEATKTGDTTTPPKAPTASPKGKRQHPNHQERRQSLGKKSKETHAQESRDPSPARKAFLHQRKLNNDAIQRIKQRKAARQQESQATPNRYAVLQQDSDSDMEGPKCDDDAIDNDEAAYATPDATDAPMADHSSNPANGNMPNTDNTVSSENDEAMEPVVPEGVVTLTSPPDDANSGDMENVPMTEVLVPATVLDRAARAKRKAAQRPARASRRSRTRSPGANRSRSRSKQRRSRSNSSSRSQEDEKPQASDDGEERAGPTTTGAEAAQPVRVQTSVFDHVCPQTVEDRFEEARPPAPPIKRYDDITASWCGEINPIGPDLPYPSIAQLLADTNATEQSTPANGHCWYWAFYGNQGRNVRAVISAKSTADVHEANAARRDIIDVLLTNLHEWIRIGHIEVAEMAKRYSGGKTVARDEQEQFVTQHLKKSRSKTAANTTKEVFWAGNEEQLATALYLQQPLYIVETHDSKATGILAFYPQLTRFPCGRVIPTVQQLILPYARFQQVLETYAKYEVIPAIIFSDQAGRHFTALRFEQTCYEEWSEPDVLYDMKHRMALANAKLGIPT